MRKLYFVFILFFSSEILNSQNLVPNGDFEQYIGCPTFQYQLDSTKFWINPSAWNMGYFGTPDYYNQCSSGTIVNIPSNYQGFQLARSGTAYAGIITYNSLFEYREYLEVPLTNTLQFNSCYHFEMYVNLSDNSQYTIDNIGVYLSDTLINGITNALPLPFAPHISNQPGNIFDTLNWTLIWGDFTASGNENYLIIGNFNSDTTSNYTYINNLAPFPQVYLYIDDVSLSVCTNINENDYEHNLSIYPNPVTDKLVVRNEQKSEIEIVNIEGEIIKVIYATENETIINVIEFPTGFYIIKSKSEKGLSINKFVKI